jgi:hypothetical protein
MLVKFCQKILHVAKKHKRSIFSTGLSIIKLQEILVIFKAVITDNHINFWFG